jgi:hypothetical protein
VRGDEHGVAAHRRDHVLPPSPRQFDRLHAADRNRQAWKPCHIREHRRREASVGDVNAPDVQRSEQSIEFVGDDAIGLRAVSGARPTGRRLGWHGGELNV